MGLLERVSKLVRSDSSRISTSTSSAEEKKSLLKKSEAFQRKPGFLQKALGMRKELTEEAAISVPPFENKLQASSKESVDFEESNSEELSIPELDEISLDANEQEEFSDSDLSISEDLVEKDSAFDEIDSQELSQDENDISIDDLFEDETTSSLDQEIVDSDKLSIQDQNEKETSSNDDITSLEEAPFDDWVKEAEQEARRTLLKKIQTFPLLKRMGFYLMTILILLLLL